MKSDESPDRIDLFEQVITFGDLKKILPSTIGRKIPRIETLFSSAKVVLGAKTTQGSIVVFDNGFYAYTEEGRLTVYGVDRCAKLTWTFCTDETQTVEGEDVENLPWTMPLEIAAADRLERNGDNSYSKVVWVSIDSPESKNNPLFSERPVYELLEEQQEYEFNRWWRIRQVQKALEKERPFHRKMLMMYGFDGKTQSDIASELGVSQQAVQQIINRFRERLREKGVKL